MVGKPSLTALRKGCPSYDQNPAQTRLQRLGAQTRVTKLQNPMKIYCFFRPRSSPSALVRDLANPNDSRHAYRRPQTTEAIDRRPLLFRPTATGWMSCHTAAFHLIGESTNCRGASGEHQHVAAIGNSNKQRTVAADPPRSIQFTRAVLAPRSCYQ